MFTFTALRLRMISITNLIIKFYDLRMCFFPFFFILLFDGQFLVRWNGGWYFCCFFPSTRWSVICRILFKPKRDKTKKREPKKVKTNTNIFNGIHASCLNSKMWYNGTAIQAKNNCGWNKSVEMFLTNIFLNHAHHFFRLRF